MFVRSVVSLKRISAFLSTPIVSGLGGVGDIDLYRDHMRRRGRMGSDSSMGVAGGMRGDGTKGNVLEEEEEAVIVFDNVTLAWNKSESIPSLEAATFITSTADHSSDTAAVSNVQTNTNTNSNASSNDGDVYSFHKSLSALTLVAYHPQGHPSTSSTSTHSVATNASVSYSNHTTTSNHTNNSHQPLITSSSSSSHTTDASGINLNPPTKPNQPTPNTTSSSAPSSTVVLRNLNFTITKGHLTVIVGTTGSGILILLMPSPVIIMTFSPLSPTHVFIGKSSLLSAILGENVATTGSVYIDKYCNLSLSTQSAFIQNGTLQSNILFGQVCIHFSYQYSTYYQLS